MRKFKRKEILSLESIKNKKPGFITSIKTGRGITGTTAQRYKGIWKIKQLSSELFKMIVYNHSASSARIQATVSGVFAQTLVGVMVK